MINGRVRLKKGVDLKVLNYFGNFRERSGVIGLNNIPDNLRWWSYWKNVNSHNMIEFIEVNIGTREIRCQGCLEEFAKMLAAGIVEIEKDPGVEITTHTLDTKTKLTVS